MSEVQTTPEFKKISELEQKLNEALIRENKLKDENKTMAEEIQWITEQYSNLWNGTFNRLFDFAGDVKKKGLVDLLVQREEERAKKAQESNTQ